MTTVINLFGAPGTGKSTLACALFSEMKAMNKNVELVREYVKEWVWEKRKIEPMDQFFITANQIRQEMILYDKVDYLVTDSPYLLGPIYESFYSNDESITEYSTMALYRKLSGNKVNYINFMLEREFKYDSNGRIQTENEAIDFDFFLKAKLLGWRLPYHIIKNE